jgi:iron complex transport system substrate-binding protein
LFIFFVSLLVVNELFSWKKVVQRICLFISTCIIIGCTGSSSKFKELKGKGFSTVKYAKGFNLQISDSGKILTVTDPWQGAKGVNYQYLFVDSSKHSTSSNADNAEVFNTPLKRLICLSTTHIAYIDELKKTSAIVGVSGAAFVNSESLLARIRSGEVKDVGYDQNLNYELIVSLKPDAVLCYGVGVESVGYLLKLKELGIRLIFIGDYLEENPLGKAEWIKAFGTLFNANDIADSIFNNIVSEYQQATLLTKSIKSKPKVFLNLPYKDAWYFPGGSNYFVKLIEDAGGDYIFKDLEGSKSYTISFEKAIEASTNADVWLNPGAVYSLSDINQIDERLLTLTPCKEGRVYNNNLRSNPSGGNDFWESGVVHPDLILKDLIYIFHSDLLPNHKFYYYRKIE